MVSLIRNPNYVLYAKHDSNNIDSALTLSRISKIFCSEIRLQIFFDKLLKCNYFRNEIEICLYTISMSILAVVYFAVVSA